MIKKLAAAALIAGASLTVAATAQAMDFPATPMNHGAPTNLPGETIIPGMTQAMQVVNGVTQPILQPILAPGGAAQPAPMMAPEGMPMHHHRMMRHHMHHKMMMKHRMMKKEMMKKGM